jgi:hypothetical protein
MVKELTQSDVKNIFEYVDGELRWKNPKTNRLKKGDVAGTFKDGYRRISLDYTLHYAHRLIWLYHYGVAPNGMLDHIDMNRSNNRIENLREVTPTQNSMNRLKNKSNKSGFKGVSFHEKTKKWRASCAVNGKQKYLGLYDLPEEAYAAYVKEVSKHHGEYGRI